MEFSIKVAFYNIKKKEKKSCILIILTGSGFFALGLIISPRESCFCIFKMKIISPCDTNTCLFIHPTNDILRPGI